MTPPSLTDLDLVQTAPTFETGVGRQLKHFFLVPGLVPDARETFLRQRHLLQAFGSVTTVTYPRSGFDLSSVHQMLQQRIKAAVRAGEQPVVVAVSIGAGIILDLLKATAGTPDELPLSGLILVSPLTCTDDLAPLLRRLVDPILNAGPDQALEALEKGRSLFRMLASRSIQGSELVGWRKGLALLTPSGLRAWHDRAVLARIDQTLAGITPQGALARVSSLRLLKGIAEHRRPLSKAPTLILWGSKERQTLSMDGPGARLLSRPDFAFRVFPHLQVQFVYDSAGDEVPHASLLKHAHAFNPHLKSFLRRLGSQDPVLKTAET